MKVWYLPYVLLLIIGGEAFSYFWHRIITHHDIIKPIRNSHRIHHQIELEYHHKAHEDFAWILMGLSVFGILIIKTMVLYPEITVPGYILLATVSSIVTWNWYIHSAYHTPEHWLNKFEWFRKDKHRHFIHHYQPELNYGIATHFSDKLLETWVDTLY